MSVYYLFIYYFLNILFIDILKVYTINYYIKILYIDFHLKINLFNKYSYYKYGFKIVSNFIIKRVYESKK